MYTHIRFSLLKLLNFYNFHKNQSKPKLIIFHDLEKLYP